MLSRLYLKAGRYYNCLKKFIWVYIFSIYLFYTFTGDSAVCVLLPITYPGIQSHFLLLNHPC